MVSVIFITKEKIVGAKIDEKQQKVKELLELGWNSNTLDIAMGQIVEKLHTKKVRILLDDAFSYLLRISIPKNLNEAEERRFVSSQIMEKIPEVLQDRDWDYKEIVFDVSQGTVKDGRLEKEVIVFSPVKYLLETISKTVSSIGLEVEAMESAEIAKTRNSDPLIGIALKEDIKGNDRKVLNIPITQGKKDSDFQDILSDEEPPQDVPGKKGDAVGEEENSNRRVVKPFILKIIIIIIVITIITVIVFLVYIKGLFYNPEPNGNLSYGITPTQSQLNFTPTPVETTEGDLSQFGVLIRNGSGTSGFTDEAVDILKEIGFEKIDAEDADNFDYSNTVVKVSDNLLEETVETITSALSQRYVIADEIEDIGDSEYDLEVIVGKLIN